MRIFPENTSENIKFCFIHLPKAAGTTLSSILDQKFNHSQIFPSSLFNDLCSKNLDDLDQYMLFRGHFYFPFFNLIPASFNFLTMLRNPEQRCISEYCYLRNYPVDDKLRKYIEIYPNNEFVRAKSLSIVDFFSHPDIIHRLNLQSSILGCDFTVPITELQTELKTEIYHRNSSSNYARESFLVRHLNNKNISDDLCSTAINRIRKFPFIGIAERFNDSLALLTYTFGWKPIKVFRNLNVSPNLGYQKIIDSESKRFLEHSVSYDFCLYEEAINIFEERYQRMMKNLQEEYNCGDPIADSDSLYNALDSHYQRSLINRLKPLDSIFFDFSCSVQGSGWHDREVVSKDLSFCWTGPENESTLDFRLIGNKRYRIFLRIINYISEEVFNSFRLQANNIDVSLKVHDHSGNIVTFVGDFFNTSTEDLCRFKFLISSTISKKSLNPEDIDDRLIGMAFEWINIDCLDS